MDKIFELLGIEKLDESKQADLKKALLTIVDTKASEIAEGKVTEMLKEKEDVLKEEYEKKFGEYKEDITTKFSNFVDSVLDEEMVIPENIKKYAHLGEAYEGLIEQFKVKLAIDEGLISEEVKGLLREAKEEIESLRESLDKVKGKNLEYEKDAASMAAHIYIRKKCDGLTESQKKQVINLLDGVIVKEDIDKKFNIIVESLKLKLDESDDEDEDDEKKEDDKKNEETKSMVCPECGAKATVKESDGETKCSECGATMKESDDKDADDKKVEEKKDDKKVDEGKETPWEAMNKLWVDMIKTGK